MNTFTQDEVMNDELEHDVLKMVPADDLDQTLPGFAILSRWDGYVVTEFSYDGTTSRRFSTPHLPEALITMGMWMLRIDKTYEVE